MSHSKRKCEQPHTHKKKGSDIGNKSKLSIKTCRVSVALEKQVNNNIKGNENMTAADQIRENLGQCSAWNILAVYNVRVTN